MTSPSGAQPVQVDSYGVRPVYGGRWLADCVCGWSTVSTGPLAEARVTRRLESHRCYPDDLAWLLGAPGRSAARSRRAKVPGGTR